MKIKIEITLDINPEVWTLEYGVAGAKAIREDVRAYAVSGVTEHFRDLGVLAEEA